MKENKEKISFNLNLDEKSFFEKAEETFKQTLFSIFFVLLKKQDTYFLMEFLKVSIQFLQFLSFSFHPSVNFIS